MVYLKTELGQTALQDRSLALTPRQRSAFILFDGKRSASEVVKATASLGVTPADIQRLVDLNLLAISPKMAAAIVEMAAAPAAAAVTAAPLQLPKTSSLTDQQRYSLAYPIATRLTANLGLRGFRLNLAVEAAGDLAKLRELAVKIQEAIGPEKFAELQAALYG